MILLGLAFVALAIVYAAHLVRDELRTLNAFVRRLVHVVDAEHIARIERDAITANAAAVATTTATVPITPATASSSVPRKRRKTQPSAESSTSPSATATMPSAAPSAPLSLHIPTQPFGTTLTPRSD